MTILARPTQCCCCCRIYGTCWADFLWHLENVRFDIFLQIWHSPGVSVTSAFSVTVVKYIDFEHLANLHFSRCFCGNEGPGFWGLNVKCQFGEDKLPYLDRRGDAAAANTKFHSLATNGSGKGNGTQTEAMEMTSCRGADILTMRTKEVEVRKWKQKQITNKLDLINLI